MMKTLVATADEPRPREPFNTAAYAVVIPWDWDAPSVHESVVNLERQGWSPANWEAVRTAVRACQVPWHVYRNAWTTFHPEGVK